MALLDGTIVGHVYQRKSGQLSFVYDELWRADSNAYPISLSLPLAASEHRHGAVNAFLWGLLPDNPRTLDHYGRLFGVSSGSALGLLAHIGADCAGAIQFATPDRVTRLTADASVGFEGDWISDTDIASELRSVRERGIPGTDARTAGQFSLAGAQPKIALLESGGRWARPRGRTPTNRILKPPSTAFRGFAENEHVCLELAAELNLKAVGSRVRRFDDELAIVIDRFDRYERNDTLVRVHQEDICQALGVLPSAKYQADGGPGASAIIALLRDSSQDARQDVGRFLDAMILSWVIAATDGHAKNFALLLGAGGGVRLAPFYDIASVLPYADRRLHRVKLAMSVGGEYAVRRIGAHHWRDFAKANKLRADDVLDRVENLLARLPAAIDHVAQRADADGLDEPTIRDLAARIHERTRDCVRQMADSRGPDRI